MKTIAIGSLSKWPHQKISKYISLKMGSGPGIQDLEPIESMLAMTSFVAKDASKNKILL